jgi:hypothetical protein
LGIVVGIVMLSAPVLLSGLGPHLLIGEIVVLRVWYLGVAGMLFTRRHPSLNGGPLPI